MSIVLRILSFNIEVGPFIGPHITVGKDRISIELSYPGHQKLLKFEHLEDYPLPERYIMQKLSIVTKRRSKALFYKTLTILHKKIEMAYI